MADAVITIDQLTSWVRRFYDLVIKNQAELTELDSAIGDADHGTNMARGMTVVINKLAEPIRPTSTNCSRQSP